MKSLSATIGIRVPEVAVGGRWRPDLRAFGIPFADNAAQWGCPRCGANVFAWKDGGLQGMWCGEPGPLVFIQIAEVPEPSLHMLI